MEKSLPESGKRESGRLEATQNPQNRKNHKTAKGIEAFIITIIRKEQV